MAPSRLLQGSARRSRPAGTATEAGTSNSVLPPYEPPTQVLGEPGKRVLANLSSNHETRHYQHHLTKSTEALQDAVGSINEHLLYQRANLNKARENSRKAGNGKSEQEQELEESVAELEAAVAELTNKSEAALREVIDFRAELEDEKKVFERVLRLAGAQRPRVERPVKAKPERRSRRGAENEDEDDVDDAAREPEDEEMPDADAADEEPLRGLPELLQSQRDDLTKEYTALSVHKRYGENNDYISFKNIWHSTLHPEDDVQLGHASTWFDAQGRPTWEQAAQADEDDELVVERVVVDLKCPLSMQLMMEPYSSRKCKHTFEKSAIMEFLKQNRGQAKCPVCTTVRYCTTALIALGEKLTPITGNNSCRSLPR
jgi:hypothetical protein